MQHVAHAGLAARKVIDEIGAHRRPAQARPIDDRLVQFAGGCDALIDHVQDFAPDGFLQPVGQVPGHFATHVQRVHANVGVELAGRLDGGRRGLLAANQLHQWQQVDRIERVANQQPFRRDHLCLKIARHQAGGARGDDHICARRAAHIGQHALLEFELLGDIFLDEIGLARHLVQVGGEAELPLGRERRERQARQRRLGIGDRVADPLLHLRLHIGGNHVDAKVQRTRGPAAADDSGAQQTEGSDLAHV